MNIAKDCINEFLTQLGVGKGKKTLKEFNPKGLVMSFWEGWGGRMSKKNQ